MSNISPSIILQNQIANQSDKPKTRSAEAGGFDALLFKNDPRRAGEAGGTDSIEISSDPKALVSDFVWNILRSLDGDYSGEKGLAPVFSFTNAFTSTFGIAGPLPDFITLITRRLNLSESQNRALQEISVRNKDITHTPENVQKIAMELQQAGIGYS